MKLLKIIKLIFILFFFVIVPTSHGGHHKACPYGEYSIDETRKEKIGGIELLKIDTSQRPIGSDNFGIVFHAYWPEKKKCVAVKRSNMNMIYPYYNPMIKREVEVLNFFNGESFNGKNYYKRKYIIEMFGYEEKKKPYHYMYVVLELGGKDLLNYYIKTVKAERNVMPGTFEYYYNIEPRTNEDFIIKIIKGAALALDQFHKFGVHGDVKAENFVVFKENEDIIESKLIDFNISVIEGQEPLEDTSELAINLKAPEIQNLNEVI